MLRSQGEEVAILIVGSGRRKACQASAQENGKQPLQSSLLFATSLLSSPKPTLSFSPNHATRRVDGEFGVLEYFASASQLVPQGLPDLIIAIQLHSYPTWILFPLHPLHFSSSLRTKDSSPFLTTPVYFKHMERVGSSSVD